MLRQNYIVKTMICYERIGDLAVNIKDEIARMRDEGTKFSDSALKELKISFEAIYEILDITAEAFKNTDSATAAKVEPLEEVIDDLVEDMNARHVYRMMNELCDPITGIRFQSILTNVEHISDKCSDIAVYILERDNHEIFGKEHSYLHELHVSNNEDYQTYYQNNYNRYFNALSEIPVEEKAE
jgi:phosphate:Na+ symporter